MMVVELPGFREMGKDTAPVLNPLPVTLNCVMVSTAVPVLLNRIVCELEVPTGTFPKLTLDGVVVSAA